MNTPLGRLTSWLLPAQVVLAVTAIVLAVAGYVSDDQSDPFYRAATLFLGDTSTLPTEPTSVTVARWLALAVTLSAVVAVSLAVLGRNASRLLIWAFDRDHVVVAGDAPEAARIAAGLRRGQPKVVLLSPRDDVGDPGRRGVRLLRGDPALERRLKTAKVQRAKAVVVAMEDDVATTHVALVATRAAPKARVVGLLRDPMARAEMQARLLGRGNHVVELLALPELIAQRAVEAVPPFGGGRIAAVLGAGPLAEALALEVARAAAPGDGAEVHVAGFEPSRLALSGLDGRVRVNHIHERDPRALADSLRGSSGAGCYVCPPAGIGEALALAAAGPGSRVLMLVDDRSEDIADAAKETLREIGAEGVTVIDIIAAVGDDGLLKSRMIEEIARAKHAQYLRDNAGGRAMGSDPSMRPWEELGAALQEDNRAFARGVVELFVEKGLRLVPDPDHRDREDVPQVFHESEIEQLARGEHDRWMAHKVKDGWTYGETRDRDRKLHPDIQPWEALDEPTRDKDRDPMRDLGGILAQAGLRVERATD